MKRKPLLTVLHALAVWVMALPLLGQTPDQIALLQKGAAAPPFRVRGLKGEHLDLSMMRGKVVVLNFWFIACPPCREEMPKLNRLVDGFAGQNVAFIAFGLDSSPQLRDFLAKTEFKYLVVPNSTKVALNYGVRGAPTHVVVDKQGKVYWIGYGALEDPERELARIIKEIL